MGDGAVEGESTTEGGSGASSQEEAEQCPEARIKAEAALLTARRNRLFLKDAIPDWIALIGYIAFGVLGIPPHLMWLPVQKRSGPMCIWLCPA